MRIGDRYIGWQVLYDTIFGVTLLTIVLVLGQLFKEIRYFLVEQHAPLWLIGKFLLLILPFSLMFTLPWGFLASTLLSFGRLSSQNELHGWRMAGLSLFRIALPVFVLGAGFAVLSNWLTGTAAPNAKRASKQLIYEAVKRDPRALLDPGVVQSRFKQQKVFVEGREEDGILRGFHIYQLSSKGRDAVPVAYVYADAVDLRVDSESQELRLKLTDAYIETVRENGSVELAFAHEAEPWLIDFSGAWAEKALKPSEITNADIPAAIEATVAEQEPYRTALAEYELTEEQTNGCHALIEQLEVRKRELQMELHMRRSISLGCLAFAIIGVPLGISARRRETSTGLLLSLLVAAGYFGCILFAEEMGHVSFEAVIAMFWAPNVVCFLLGIWLFRRASRR